LKQSGNAAIKAKNSKHQSHATAYDADAYDFCRAKDLQKSSKMFRKKAGKPFNKSEGKPRIHRSQFAYKWKRRVVLAFKKTQAQQMLQLRRRIIRTKLQRSSIPVEYDELYL